MVRHGHQNYQLNKFVMGNHGMILFFTLIIIWYNSLIFTLTLSLPGCSDEELIQQCFLVCIFINFLLGSCNVSLDSPRTCSAFFAAIL